MSKPCILEFNAVTICLLSFIRWNLKIGPFLGVQTGFLGLLCTVRLLLYSISTTTELVLMSQTGTTALLGFFTSVCQYNCWVEKQSTNQTYPKETYIDDALEDD